MIFANEYFRIKRRTKFLPLLITELTKISLSHTEQKFLRNYGYITLHQEGYNKQ